MSKKNLLFAPIILLAITLYSVENHDVDSKKKYTKSNLDVEIEEKVDSVLDLMNLNEKIGQLVQYSGKWNTTGPLISQGDQHKLDKLKKGEVGAMLNMTSVASIKETQKFIMEHSRLKIPLIFGYVNYFHMPLNQVK